MSLYLEAAKFLVDSSSSLAATGSLKSRVYGATGLKNRPAHIFALVSEATKWSRVLSEVVERSGLLREEKKFTPAIALLLVHDLLLSKDGVAAAKGHALRLAIKRHKARLSAEFTRARLRLGFSSVEAWKSAIESGVKSTTGNDETTDHVHPRWVRVNTLLSDAKTELQTTFSGYDTASLSSIVSRDSRSDGKKLIAIDTAVSDLIALQPSSTEEVTKAQAYKSGRLILQDKASCLPALLLDPRPEDGDIIDACAAPGNKTTHLAALLARARQHLVSAPPRKGSAGLSAAKNSGHAATNQTIFAVERSPERSHTLRKMVRLAGADGIVTCLAGQDFLALDPRDARFANVGALLLDPSCSGSGIIGRDDNDGEESAGAESISSHTAAVLPRCDATPSTADERSHGKKRKRRPAAPLHPAPHPAPLASSPENTKQQSAGLSTSASTSTSTTTKTQQNRLHALSTFQQHLLKHALRFPAARKVIYSTCSVHFSENEAVAVAALRSDVARERGWRVLRRSEQASSLVGWEWRGSMPMDELDSGKKGGEEEGFVREVLDACIRCRKGTQDGTMGFFVVGFVRDGGDDASWDAQRKQGRFTEKGDRGGEADDDEGEEVQEDAAQMEQTAEAEPEDDGDEDVWEGFSADDDDDDDELAGYEMENID